MLFVMFAAAVIALALFGLFLIIRLVCLHYALHELVTHDILLAELYLAYARYVAQNLWSFTLSMT